MQNQIQQAIQILQQGGVVIFPTDTAFGIGCRMDDEIAIKKLFSVKERPMNQAVPVLVGSIKMAKEYWEETSSEVENLTHLYWPGALTIVYPCKSEKVSQLVRGEGNLLGLRQPGHPTTLALIQALGVPLIGTSANIHGEPTPFSHLDLDAELLQRVDFVVEGECTICEPSTVLDCSEKPWKVLRQGAVIVEETV